MYIHHKKGRVPHQVQIYAEEQEWRSYTWNRCREGAIFVFQHQRTRFHDYCIRRGLQGMQVNFVGMCWLATVVFCSSICSLFPLVIFHPESLRLQNTVWRISNTRWLFFSVISCANKVMWNWYAELVYRLVHGGAQALQYLYFPSVRRRVLVPENFWIWI